MQEAKHQINKQKEGSKILDSIYEEADQRFRESEILPLQRKYHLDTEHQVREKLAEQGKSLAEMQQGFRQLYLAESYLHSKVHETGQSRAA